MAEQDLKDVLTEYQNLAESEHHGFLNSQVNSYSFVSTVFQSLQLYEDRVKPPELLQPLCDFLYTIYRKPESEFKRFSLQFLPCLINIYLVNASSGVEKQSYICLETLLIGIYNLEIQEVGTKVQSFRVPTLSQSSIYHDWNQLGDSRHPISLPGPELGMERGGSFLKVERPRAVPTVNITAQNRLRVVAHLFGVYTNLLGEYSKESLGHSTRACTRIVTRGFTFDNRNKSHRRQHSYGTETGMRSPRNPPVRIPVSSQLLIEMLQIAYVSIFSRYDDREHNQPAGQTLVRDIEFRARHDSLATAILVAKAVSGVAPLATLVEPTTLAAPTQLSKNMITNASFRTKKLEGDIPRVEDEEGNSLETTRQNPMTVISEEMEDQVLVVDKKHDGRQKENETNMADKFKAKLENVRMPIRKKDKEKERAASESSDKEEKVKSEKKEKNFKRDRKTNDTRNSFHQNSIDLNADGVDKSEEIIRMNQIPSETIAIHSPESGSTTFH